MGERWREENTNSGEERCERCDRNCDFHGAGGTRVWVVVLDMVWRRERRRREGEDAMVVGCRRAMFENG